MTLTMEMRRRKERRIEIGDWRLEIGDWRLEFGDWRLGIGGWNLFAIWNF